MSCDEHADQNVIAFCEDCDTMVCYDCITDTHKKHEFEKLAKIAEQKREQILKEFVTEKENILSDLRDRYEGLEASKTEGSNLEESIIKDIHDRAEEIKSQVDTTRDKQTSEVRRLFKAQKEVLDGKVTNVNEANEKITNLSDETALQNKSDIEIIQLYASINKKLEEVRNTDKVSLIEGKFISGGDFEENLEKMFGSFENENETSSDDLDLSRQVETKSRKLEQVDLGLKGVLAHMHMTGEDSGWILSNQMILYFANSIATKSYNEKAKGVLSFAVSEKGEVYFVTSSSVVQKIDINGTVTRWSAMAPYKPEHIFIRKPGEISIFLWSKTAEMYFLLRFDEIGRRLEKKTLQTVTTSIDRLAENEFGELCMRYYHDRGHLLTLDVNLSRSNFSGVLGANPTKNYYIMDFCYVSKGRIVALDNTNNVIYLLDRKCSFIKLLTSIDEIESMKYVTIDRFYRLWISTDSCTYILSNWDQ